MSIRLAIMGNESYKSVHKHNKPEALDFKNKTYKTVQKSKRTKRKRGNRGFAIL